MVLSVCEARLASTTSIWHLVANPPSRNVNLAVPADECVKKLETQLHAPLHNSEPPYIVQNIKSLIEHK